MQSKVRDACIHAKSLRRQRDVLKKRLSKKLGGSKSFGRRVLDKLFLEYKSVKSQKILENEAKLTRIQKSVVGEKEIKAPPESTADYLSNVNVFSESQHSLTPQASDGPFVCDSSINLSKNELKLLARGPKFMVREQLDSESFEVELEKKNAHVCTYNPKITQCVKN